MSFFSFFFQLFIDIFRLSLFILPAISLRADTFRLPYFTRDAAALFSFRHYAADAFHADSPQHYHNNIADDAAHARMRC